ncbi:phosphatidylserine decarboxylase [Rhodoligotrophos appendicifer]|uniref:phosphatidylserine decarboxylase n=1 Tax=Rhodoligotrophos appendicifer TaxID=987056 RepID=UPI0011862688|nr:phosphatidylserine decarboxylase [Rhodoligotrophos appendicifer]
MDILATIRATLTPVHREGYRFVAIFAAITLILFLFVSDTLGWIGVVLTLWCAYFFRNPDRVTPLREGLVISPADGRISAIQSVVPPPELGFSHEPRIRISVFMNVFDVHVNRAPVAGRITRMTYIPGKFINAELDKASEDNERQAFAILMADGEELGVVQIAGLVARRIVPFVRPETQVFVGERIGLIRFGSRVDVFLPVGKTPLVSIGQRAIAGETVFADLRSVEPERIARLG